MAVNRKKFYKHVLEFIRNKKMLEGNFSLAQSGLRVTRNNKFLNATRSCYIAVLLCAEGAGLKVSPAEAERGIREALRADKMLKLVGNALHRISSLRIEGVVGKAALDAVGPIIEVLEASGGVLEAYILKAAALNPDVGIASAKSLADLNSVDDAVSGKEKRLRIRCTEELLNDLYNSCCMENKGYNEIYIMTRKLSKVSGIKNYDADLLASQIMCKCGEKRDRQTFEKLKGIYAKYMNETKGISTNMIKELEALMAEQMESSCLAKADNEGDDESRIYKDNGSASIDICNDSIEIQEHSEEKLVTSYNPVQPDIAKMLKDAFTYMVCMKTKNNSDKRLKSFISEVKVELEKRKEFLAQHIVKIGCDNLDNLEEIKKLSASFADGSIKEEDNIRLRSICTNDAISEWESMYNEKIKLRIRELTGNGLNNKGIQDSRNDFLKMVEEEICQRISEEIFNVSGVYNYEVSNTAARIISKYAYGTQDSVDEFNKKSGALFELKREYEGLIANPARIENEIDIVMGRMNYILQNGAINEKIPENLCYGYRERKPVSIKVLEKNSSKEAVPIRKLSNQDVQRAASEENANKMKLKRQRKK